MSAYTGTPNTVHVFTNADVASERMEYRGDNAEMNVNVDTGVMTITARYVTAIPRHSLPPARDDMMNLAYAVLEGDHDAALLLADMVSERHVKGESYVSPDVLAKALEPFAKLGEWLDLNPVKTPDRPLRMRINGQRVYAPEVRFDDFRDASVALDRYKGVMKE